MPSHVLRYEIFIEFPPHIDAKYVPRSSASVPLLMKATDYASGLYSGCSVIFASINLPNKTFLPPSQAVIDLPSLSYIMHAIGYKPRRTSLILAIHPQRILDCVYLKPQTRCAGFLE